MTRLAGLFAAALFSLAATTAAAQSADLSVTITDGQTTVTPGSASTYTITMTNLGPDMAAGLTFVSTLPPSLGVTSMAWPGGWSCSLPPGGGGGTITCTVLTMMAGQSNIISLTTQVNPSVPAGSVISNSATFTSTTSDPNPANNSATDTNTVPSAPPAAVPTLTEWAMILFGALLAGGAVLQLQRRRTTA